MAWKIVERASIVLGLFIAAATLYYTAAAYYETVGTAPTTKGAVMMPSSWWFWFWVGGLLSSVALLATAWAMMFIRGRKHKPIPTPTKLRLQFQPNDVNVRTLIGDNIGATYAMRNSFALTVPPNPQMPQGQQIEVRQWLIFIVFDQLITLRQITFDGHGAQLPAIEVKDRSARHAVVLISGDLGAVMLDINFHVS